MTICDAARAPSRSPPLSRTPDAAVECLRRLCSASVTYAVLRVCACENMQPDAAVVLLCRLCFASATYAVLRVCACGRTNAGRSLVSRSAVLCIRDVRVASCACGAPGGSREGGLVQASVGSCRRVTPVSLPSCVLAFSSLLK